MAAFFLGAAFLLPTLALAAPVKCECVRYAREVLGANVRGDAKTLVPNTPITHIIEGDVILFYYPATKIFHAAVAIKVEDGFITFAETNYKRCTPGVRTLHFTDSTITGVYRSLSPTQLY